VVRRLTCGCNGPATGHSKRFLVAFGHNLSRPIGPAVRRAAEPRSVRQRANANDRSLSTRQRLLLRWRLFRVCVSHAFSGLRRSKMERLFRFSLPLSTRKPPHRRRLDSYAGTRDSRFIASDLLFRKCCRTQQIRHLEHRQDRPELFPDSFPLRKGASHARKARGAADHRNR